MHTEIIQGCWDIAEVDAIRREEEARELAELIVEEEKLSDG